MRTTSLTRCRPLLGTYVEIALHGAVPTRQLEAWIQAGFDAIAVVDQRMSVHRTDSDVTRLNQTPEKEWLNVAPETIAVLKKSNALFYASGGIFDIRCGATLLKNGLLPNHCLISRRPAISEKNPPVEIRGQHVRKTGPWVLDLGGIAKGFAVDSAVKTIRRASRGLSISGTVNAGGDLRTWGQAISALARVAENPTPMLRSFPIQQTALATSSSRVNVDPRFSPAAHVRMPSQRLIRRQKAVTVSIFAKDCMVADALTKVVLLADTATAKTILKAHDARAIIFSSRGWVRTVMTA